ncbi:hypothetical protein DSM106972_072240 [Dulcicalothrix desertica PCC 7102]|uniref:DUF928 domain-containing protein n=1 Tax=Dulcicalothrix desertica PCC 7102 TaxID=232991 RepID=A0A3S1IQS3_9CYAN|nr:DUF928 domain-containing protein [Dulcicalothrix desertica]RUT00815.1 hypothetical protein DSM106972_072240 [Dulcicalothrix desertica PCC 7102]TWH42343.1 uncharacterized protein DUF928 [Dulcicalothrix desertica PCC 7102]
MSKQKTPYRNPKNQYISLFCSLILFFSILTPVSAYYLANAQSPISQNSASKQPKRRNVTEGYRKRTNAKKITSQTTITAKRGSGSCEKRNSQIQLTTLAPKNYLGLITSENPTLAWYIPDSGTYPIRIFVYRNEEKNPFYSTSMGEILSKKGINEYTLPKTLKLSYNEKYTWRVKIYCNLSDISDSYQDESKFTLDELSPELKSTIKSRSNSLDKAKIYASDGIWYDAFMQTLRVQQDKSTRDYQRLLLSTLIEEDANEDANENANKELQQRLQGIINELEKS